jgi:transposase-like protein
VISALLATAFAQETPEAARQEWRRLSDRLHPKLPKLARLMDEAEADVLAYKAFPSQHWPKIATTNPLERTIGEIKRRTDLVGIFPNEAAILRLVGAVLMEQDADWATPSRRYMTLDPHPALGDDPIASLGATRTLASPGPAGKPR